jgi:hypothetical protein
VKSQFATKHNDQGLVYPTSEQSKVEAKLWSLTLEVLGSDLGRDAVIRDNLCALFPWKCWDSISNDV